MRKIKIAQIGTSAYSHGSQIFDVLKNKSDIFEIVGYALPENEREKFPDFVKTFEGYCEMSVDEILKSPEIEAVFVETEEIYLTKYALMAAESKKHIHLEKPGGIELSDFKKLISTVKKNGTIFHTGYMYRYNPCIKKLKEKIKNGEFGRIISIEAQMNECYHTIDRQWLDTFPGGMMFFLGGHLIDFILQIKGLPESISSFNRCTGTGGITSTDFAMAVLTYSDGACLVKAAANEIGQRRHFAISGETKTAVIDPIEEYRNGKIYATLREFEKGRATEITSSPFNRYDAMLEAFAAMVRGEDTNPYTPDYELILYKTLLECCK